MIGSPSNLDSKSVFLKKSDPLSFQEQGSEAYSGDGKFIKKNCCRLLGWLYVLAMGGGLHWHVLKLSLNLFYSCFSQLLIMEYPLLIFLNACSNKSH